MESIEMNNLGYAELQRLKAISQAQKLQARELSELETFECSWICVIILGLAIIAGLFY